MKSLILFFLIALISCQMKNTETKNTKLIPDPTTETIKKEVEQVNTLKILGGTVGRIDDIKIAMYSLPSQEHVDENPEKLQATIDINKSKYVDVRVGTVVKLTENLEIEALVIKPYTADNQGFVEFKINRKN